MTNRRYIPRFREFAGGLNLLAQSELGLDDLAAAFNITIDERGGATSRFGFTSHLSIGGATKVLNLGYQPEFPFLFEQVGADLKIGGSTLHTFSTADRCAMADFAGVLVIVHPVDGTFTSNGATVTAVAAGPKADAIAVWQNKLWTNDRAGGATRARVHFSAAGDPTTWAGTADFRDVDDTQVVALFSGQGQDIKGAPGLVVCKSNSTYRINDSTTGAYTTIDPFTGAASALSIAGANGRIFILSSGGVFQTDGVSGLVKVSGKLDPLFTPAAINMGAVAGFAAGATRGRVFFSLALAGSSANNLMLEYHPEGGWFTLNSNAATCYAYMSGTGILVFGSPTVNGKIYQVDPAAPVGTDDGTAINAYLQTSFIELHYGLRARLNSARVNARGTFTLSPLYDYDLTPTITRAISVPTGSATIHGGYQDVLNLGQAKTIAFRAEATTSTTATIPLQVSGLTTRTVGAWGLYGIDPYPFPAPLGRT